jgi:hypothetical protein
MQRTQSTGAATRHAAFAEAAAAAEAVAALLDLDRSATNAKDLGRMMRAAELYERALAAAAASQPHNSLIIAGLSGLCAITRVGALTAGCSADLSARARMMAEAWHDEQALLRSRHALDLLHARWRAGSLCILSAAEHAFFELHLHLHFSCKGTAAAAAAAAPRAKAAPEPPPSPPCALRAGCVGVFAR